jgi:cytochrome b
MAIAFITIKIGGNAMVWHAWAGYGVLTLILFRIIWGLVGPYHARFINFIKGPTAIQTYLKGEKTYIGHNPLGALSVLGLLGVCGFQAVSGLFANDDIAFDGPLTVLIDKDLSDAITHWHHINEKIILLLVVLHILAIVLYRVIKRKNLVQAMVLGDQRVEASELPVSASRDDLLVRLLGFFLLIICGAGVWWLIHHFPPAY